MVYKCFKLCKVIDFFLNSMLFRRLFAKKHFFSPFITHFYGLFHSACTPPDRLKEETGKKTTVFAYKRIAFCLQAKGLLLRAKRSFACKQKYKGRRFFTWKMQKVAPQNGSFLTVKRKKAAAWETPLPLPTIYTIKIPTLHNGGIRDVSGYHILKTFHHRFLPAWARWQW
ncbi:MAG: hypothetical protein IJ928_04540 [Prevotella sp.]|nr:hypothetical protein [Prevotella sp.]